MEMDDAAGTITQVLVVIDRTPAPYESIRSGERAQPQKHPGREPAARQLHHTNVFAPSDRAKFLDYIETILHCKGLSYLLIGRAYTLLGFDPDLPKIAPIVTVTRRSGETARHTSRSWGLLVPFFHGNDNVAFDTMGSALS